MKNLALACVVALAFCPMAAVADIAISTQAGWFGQAAADREMQEIVDNVTGVAIERFASGQQDALADWVVAHTGDGVSDILILCGVVPATIYPAGNAEPDGSIAELFLDDGNTIINTGDYMFYVGTAGNNDAGGLENMMDIAGISMWDDDTAVSVTAKGHAVAPSLQDFLTDRPFHINELQGDWVPELILAQNGAGTRADPIIVVNTVTGGRLGIFYQTASQDNDPRGEVISEWINNFVLTGGVIPNRPAEKPDPQDGAVDVTMPLLQWTAGYGAVVHNVYFGETPETLAMMMATPTPMYFHPTPLTPEATYYWRVDEVDADGDVTEGDVWSFTVMPVKATEPDPFDGATYMLPGLTLTWKVGQNQPSHDVYLGTDEALVAAGDASVFQGNQAANSFATGPLELETTYYWRVDEIDVMNQKFVGDVWSFTTTLPGLGTAKREIWEEIGGGTSVNDLLAADAFPCCPTTVDEVPAFKSPPFDPDKNNYGGRLSAWLYVPAAGDYTFWVSGDDNCRLFLSAHPGKAKLIAEVPGWTPVDTWDWYAEQQSAPVTLEEGAYYLEALWKEGGGGDSCSAAWQIPGTSRQVITGGYLEPFEDLWAVRPAPADGATDITRTPELAWYPGVKAAGHDVYFGDDAGAVAAADTSSPLYQGRLAADVVTFSPGGLELDKTYYWRVDEVNEVEADSPWGGAVWSFTVANYLVIDDFEAYDILPIDPVGAPIAWYEFEGDLTDSSGNGHDGTPFGDISFADDPVMGQVLSLPGGDNQYVLVGEVGISGTMPTTIACWAKADNTSIPDWTLIFGFTTTGGGCGSHFNVGSLGGPGGVGAHCWCWEETIFTDQQALDWHHYAMTYDGTTILYYGDGVLMDTDVGKSNVQDLSIRGDNVQIGSRITQASSFPGDVDDARIYDYMLSPAEIAGLAGFVPSLVLPDVWSDEGTVASSLDTDVTHGGGGAMRLDYDTSAAPKLGYASRDVPMADWTQGGADGLSLWFRGDPGNAAVPLYVAVQDTAGRIGVVTHPKPAAMQAGQWQKWTVSLSHFSAAGVKLTSIARVGVGVGDGKTKGAGSVVIDDLRVVRTHLVVVNPSFEQPGVADKGYIGPPMIRGFDRVPGWSTDKPVTRSGLIKGARPTDGAWSAHLTAGDASVWQLTGHVIEEGQVLELDINAWVILGAIRDARNNLKMSLYYDDGGKRVTVSSYARPLPYDRWTYMVKFDAANAPEAVGHKIGIEFSNVSDNVLSLDNVHLRVR